MVQVRGIRLETQLDLRFLSRYAAFCRHPLSQPLGRPPRRVSLAGVAKIAWDVAFSKCTKGARWWGTAASAAAQQGAHENQSVLGCSKLPSREFSGGNIMFDLDVSLLVF